MASISFPAATTYLSGNALPLIIAPTHCGGGVEVVLEALVDTAELRPGIRSLDVLRPGGLLVAIPSGVSPELHAAADARGLRSSAFLVEPDGPALTRIAELIDAGEVRVQVEAALN
jgi:hypothetical protein